MELRRAIRKGVGIAAVAALFIFGTSRSMSRPPQADATRGSGRVPVLVELFTSEGCSSCPPADALLQRLQREQPVPGVEIVALEQHVDYWNSMGWSDPFSSRQFSGRQQDYGRAFRLRSVYTPQMVVGGTEQLVGSDQPGAEKAIARAASCPRAQVKIESGGSAGLRVTVDGLPAVSRGDSADVYLAMVEANLSSKVARGENAGRRLTHTAVARQLARLGTAVPGRPFAATRPVTPEPGWKRPDLSVVVFVQERRSLRILGAAEAPVECRP